MRSPNLRRQLLAVFGTMLIFITVSATHGIIGNQTYALFPALVTFLRKYIEVKDLSYIVFLFLILLLLSWYLAQYRIALRNASSLNKIDDYLIKSIAILYKSSDAEKEERAERITRRVLKKVLDVNPFKVCGAAIYRSICSYEYLNTWIYISDPNETNPGLSFYVGDMSGPETPSGGRGVAGTAFISNKTIIVRFDKNGNAENCDVYFPFQDKGTYRSLICIPIQPAEDGPNLGILCLYSKKYNCFNAAAETFLTTISQRLSVILEPLTLPTEETFSIKIFDQEINPNALEELKAAILQYAEAAGYEDPKILSEEHGSFFSEIRYKVAKILAPDLIEKATREGENLYLHDKEKLEKTGIDSTSLKYDLRGAQFAGGFGETVLGGQTGGAVNNETSDISTRRLASATVDLLKAVENFDNIVLTLEKIMLVKYTAPDGKTKTIVRTVSTKIQNKLESTPYILDDPRALLAFLQEETVVIPKEK